MIKASKINFKVFTIFPEIFPGTLGVSVIGNALKKGIWNLNTVNLRDYANDTHKSVDDAPYGGGAGMVMKAEIVDNALSDQYNKNIQKPKLIYLSPRGKKIEQKYIDGLSSYNEIGILCGRFEGVDQRVLDYWDFEEVSIGDFIISGGEVAAQALIDSIVRSIPGVLGNDKSLINESFYDGLLEYNHYTRPAVWNDCKVPEILLSGNHAQINLWRVEQSKQITRDRRPDLWDKYIKFSS